MGPLSNGEKGQPDQRGAWLAGDLGWVTSPLPQTEGGNNDRIKNVSLGPAESQGRKRFVKRKSNGLALPAVM